MGGLAAVDLVEIGLEPGDRRLLDEFVGVLIDRLDAGLDQTGQRIFAEQLPILYFAAPRVYVATSNRVLNATPVLLRPVVLWSADTVAVQARRGGSSRTGVARENPYRSARAELCWDRLRTSARC